MGLDAFEGHQVVAAKLRVTRAGDGLSEALKLEPRALLVGEEVFFVLRGQVTQVNHRSASKDKGDLLVRVHTVEAQEIAMVGQAEVDELLAAERDRVKQLRDEEAGREPLPLAGDSQSSQLPADAETLGEAPSGGWEPPAPPPGGPPLENYDTATVEDILTAVAVFDAEQIWMTVEWEEAHQDRAEITKACFARLDELGAD